MIYQHLPVLHLLEWNFLREGWLGENSESFACDNTSGKPVFDESTGQEMATTGKYLTVLASVPGGPQPIQVLRTQTTLYITSAKPVLAGAL